MTRLLTSTLFILLFAFQATAQETKDQHLLDGTSMDYYYQDGGGVHAEFKDGQFNFQWILGPNKGATGSCAYRSKKIGDKLYFVNFLYKPSAAFVSIVFNFNENVISTSALIGAGTQNETIIFEGGIIEHLQLKES